MGFELFTNKSKRVLDHYHIFFYICNKIIIQNIHILWHWESFISSSAICICSFLYNSVSFTYAPQIHTHALANILTQYIYIYTHTHTWTCLHLHAYIVLHLSAHKTRRVYYVIYCFWAISLIPASDVMSFVYYGINLDFFFFSKYLLLNLYWDSFKLHVFFFFVLQCIYQH